MTRTFHPLVAPRMALLPPDAQSWDEVPADVAAAFDADFGPLESWDVTIGQRDLPGPHGPIPARIYARADSGEDRPCLVWCHGGGWVFGDLDMPEGQEVARGIAGRSGAVVVSVDYRLCNDGVTFPVPHDDVMAAFDWTLAHADDLGIDASRVAIGGASAGANLAAGVTQHLADEGRTPWQLLLSYPIVHAPLPEPSAELAEALQATPTPLRFLADTTGWMVANLLGHDDLTSVQPYAMPGNNGRLNHFPPTFIDNDEFDDLRASGERFAQQLRDAGVDVVCQTSPGVFHGHLNKVGLDVTHRSLDAMAARLTREGTPR